MRGATQCARRLKQVFRSLRTRLGKVSRPSRGDPVTQMILGIFSRDLPESKAREALDRLRGMVVDYNELRVIAALELAEMLGDYPDVRLKCEDVSRALNSIFAREHTISLDGIAELPKKEMRAYLEQIEGLEAYTRARMQLQGFQRHAIPLDEAMWAYARNVGIVDKRCPLVEAECFLERQIPEQDALEFVALFKRHAWAEMGALVRRGEVERIHSVPPDRTASHMLQVASQASAAAAGPPTPEAEKDDRAKVVPTDTATPTAAVGGKRGSAASHRERSKRKAPVSPKAKAKPKAKTEPKAKRQAKGKRATAARSARKTTGRRAAASRPAGQRSRRATARTKST
jgi:hypothetical protein